MKIEKAGICLICVTSLREEERGENERRRERLRPVLHSKQQRGDEMKRIRNIELCGFFLVVCIMFGLGKECSECVCKRKVIMSI